MTVPDWFDNVGLVGSSIRAVLVGMALAAVVPTVERTLAANRWVWMAVLLPLLTPSVVVAFAYVGWSPGTPATVQRELGYAALLLARLLPIAVILQVVLPPPPMSREARHCLRLSGFRGAGFRGAGFRETEIRGAEIRGAEFRGAELRGAALRSVGAYIRGPFRNFVVVAGLMSVLAFQEFDLASLFFGVRSWTVALFDAQAGGLPLSHTLSQAAAPTVLQALVLVTVYVFFRFTRSEGRLPSDSEEATRRDLWVGRFLTCLSAALIAVYPAIQLLPAIPSLGAQWAFLDHVRHSLVLALGAVLCAGALGVLCPLPVLLTLSVPGLCGGVVIGLSTLALFQSPSLVNLYDTPSPLLLAWTAMLLPLVTVFRLAIERLSPARSLHVARHLSASAGAAQARRGRSLEFALRGSHVGLAAVVLFTGVFFELVVAHLLAPGNMPPAAPILGNMMHYGRSPGLAAMVLLMTGSALTCGVIGYLGWMWGASMWRAGSHLRGAGTGSAPSSGESSPAG